MTDIPATSFVNQLYEFCLAMKRLGYSKEAVDRLIRAQSHLDDAALLAKLPQLLADAQEARR